MSKSIYVNGVKAKGCYHNGIKYTFASDEITKIASTCDWVAYYTRSKSVSSSSTSSGYIVCTPTVNTSTQFRIYKYPDVTNYLTSMPTYKFMHKDGSTSTQITTLSLVYDGNGYFHLSGSLDIRGYGAKGEGKLAVDTYSQNILTLEDNDGNIYYLNRALPISVTRDESGSTSYTFNVNTITTQSYRPALSGTEQKVTTVNLPITWNSSVYSASHSFTTINEAYIVLSSTSTSTTTGSGNTSNFTYSFVVE